jgi:hypothetical protein
MTRGRLGAILALALVLPALWAGPSSADPTDVSLDPQKNTLSGSPADHLPPYVRKVLGHGMRPDWSPDGRRLLYLDAPLGDVWRLDLRTGRKRNLTGSLHAHGFLRAHHLPSGDLVLCGPDHEVDRGGEEPGRFESRLWLLPRPYTKLTLLGPSCWEGIAVSRRTDRIAWNESTIDFTHPDQEFVAGRSEIWTGDITRGRRGKPRLTKVERVATRADFDTRVAPIEVQDFRGPAEDELLLTAYGVLTGEVYGLDLRTGATRNYSGYSPFYEEVEGTARSGRYAIVERDLMVNPIPGTLDLWALALDGSAAYRRITHFNRYRGYGASNPVVSPDDRHVAFQLSVADGAEGEGAGIYLLNLRRALRAG